MVEEKLSTFQAEIKDLFLQLRSMVFAVAPNAEEKMWAGLPSYYVGEAFVRLIPFKDHINVEASALADLKTQLCQYKFTPKDMLQIYVEQAVPTEILADAFKKSLSV